MPRRLITLVLPNPLATNTTTQIATSAMTTGVGLVDPTAPVRVAEAPEKGRITLVFLAPAAMQSGDCQPTGACCMQSTQIGRSQWAQIDEAIRSGWLAHMLEID